MTVQFEIASGGHSCISAFVWVALLHAFKITNHQQSPPIPTLYRPPGCSHQLCSAFVSPADRTACSAFQAALPVQLPPAIPPTTPHIMMASTCQLLVDLVKPGPTGTVASTAAVATAAHAALVTAAPDVAPAGLLATVAQSKAGSSRSISTVMQVSVGHARQEFITCEQSQAHKAFQYLKLCSVRQRRTCCGQLRKLWPQA